MEPALYGRTAAVWDSRLAGRSRCFDRVYGAFIRKLHLRETFLFLREIDAPRTLAPDLDGEPDTGGIMRRIARHIEGGVWVGYLPGSADSRFTDRALPPRCLEAEVARRREIERSRVGQRGRGRRSRLPLCGQEDGRRTGKRGKQGDEGAASA